MSTDLHSTHTVLLIFVLQKVPKFFNSLVLEQYKQIKESSLLKTLETFGNSVTRVFFLPLLSFNFDEQLSSNFHRFVIC